MAQNAQKAYSKYQENGANRTKFREYYYLVTQELRIIWRRYEKANEINIERIRIRKLCIKDTKKSSIACPLSFVKSINMILIH